MLTSLLPGLRQIRAPLSAGFVWLLGLWLLVDPHLADGGEVRTMFERVDVAVGEASAVGVGAAWTFAAYLIGSVAIGALRGVFKSALGIPWLGGKRALGATLLRLCQRTRIRLETTLELTDVELGGFLRQHVGADTRSRRQQQNGGRGPDAHPPLSSSALVSKVVDLNAERESRNLDRERLIAHAVLGEIEDVAMSRLLGKEAELYGEWDRDRAEVDLRLALAPALLFTAVAVATHGSWWWLAVPLSLLVSWRLLRDAARSDLHAQEVLIVALANDRVQSPVIERLVVAAEEAAQYRARDTIDAAAVKASSILAEALSVLERAPESGAAATHQAKEIVDRAADAFSEGKPLFNSEAVERFESALQALRPVTQAWADVIEGKGPPSFDMQAAVQAARDHHARFLQAIRGQIARPSMTAAGEGTG